MPGFLDLKAVVEPEKLRPVRFIDTGRSRLGKILKAAREVRGWSIIETEIVTEGMGLKPRPRRTAFS